MREIEENTKDFYAGIVSYGSTDIETAIKIFLDVDKSGDDLAEEVKRFSEDTGTKLEDVDVCYVAYETILQEARNKIEEILGFDFLNEGSGRDIYTYGNYCCSQYDSTQGLKDELKERLNDIATEEERKEKIKELKEDVVIKWFLDDIDFEWGED